MATHNIRAAAANVQQHPLLSYVAQWEPEEANATWKAGTFVYWSSGLLATSVDPIDGSAEDNSAAGLAIEDGHNLASGALCKFIPAIGGVMFFANLMTGDGANFTMDGDELGEIHDLASKTGLYRTGVDDWFIDNASGVGGVVLVSFRNDNIIPNQVETRSVAGDVNARVGFVLTSAANGYYK